MKLQTPNRKRLIATRASIALCIVLLGVIFIPPLLRRHTSRGIINAYLATKAVHMLQIGAGDSEKDGWLNTDIEPRAKEAFLDASKPFPLPDQCMHYVHSEHVIEHLTFDGGQVMLKESFRVLDHGGRVRIATPSLVKVVAVLQDPPTPAAAEYAVAGEERNLRMRRTAGRLVVDSVRSALLRRRAALRCGTAGADLPGNRWRQLDQQDQKLLERRRRTNSLMRE